MASLTTYRDAQTAEPVNRPVGVSSGRKPMEADELLVAGARYLLERECLPVSVKRKLYSLKYQTRRVAVRQSAFATLIEAMSYARQPANALWFPRQIEAEVYGRCAFPTLNPDVAHASESDANRGFDVTQIQHRSRKTHSTLDELLFAALVQETATRAVAASEAAELRVRSVMMGW